MVGSAALVAILSALAPAGNAAANGWGHAGIPYEALIAALDYDDPELRKRAAHSLGRRGQQEAVPHLLVALAKPEPDHGVRSRVYMALGRLGEPSAGPVLLHCLGREGCEELRGDAADRGPRRPPRPGAPARRRKPGLARRPGGAAGARAKRRR